MAETTVPTPTNFTLAFQQMASFVAIAKTRATSEVLDELIQQCFVILANEQLSDAHQVAEALEALFGIRLNAKDVEFAIQRLKKVGTLADIGNGHLSLSQAAQVGLKARIAAAVELEADVRANWLSQVGAANLSGDGLWSALRSYLAQAFRRHGIQAVELIDGASTIADEAKGSLLVLLDKAVAEWFPSKDRAAARDAISGFFLQVGSDRKRAEYIANLADGAFNYFCLAVAPEVSEKLRGGLSNLTLFLDTNFLFGLLDLHANSQVDVSAELVESITRFKLPFRLRYHDATVREMTNTLFYYDKELKKQKWPVTISRAIVASGHLSGIEFRYHSKNAVHAVAVEDFFAPYSHWQILVKDKGIDVYHGEASEARLAARADMEADYVEYLKSAGREKPHDAIQHDMAVLETVQSLRTNARNTLEAGHLLVTCDYHLFRFDFERSRKAQRHHSTVLPSLLWQILRPYVSDNEEFDQAFAETFALPEFTLNRGGAQRAATRMASILAGYSDIPEETATKMLANDLLIAELQTKRSEKEFADTVESAVAAENAQLIEERAALADQLQREKQEHQAKQLALADATRVIQERQDALSTKEAVIRAKEIEIARLTDQTRAQSEQVVVIDQKAAAEAFAKEQANRKVIDLEVDLHRTRRQKWQLIASVITLTSVGMFELIIRVLLPWNWLLRHPNGYGLEGCALVVVASVVLATLVAEWRKPLLVGGAVAAFFVGLALLGGPK